MPINHQIFSGFMKNLCRYSPFNYILPIYLSYTSFYKLTFIIKPVDKCFKILTNCWCRKLLMFILLRVESIFALFTNLSHRFYITWNSHTHVYMYMFVMLLMLKGLKGVDLLCSCCFHRINISSRDKLMVTNIVKYNFRRH